MKNCRYLLLFAFSWVSMHTTAQTVVGHVETFEGEILDLHARPDKKVNITRMPNGCECQLKPGKGLLYLDQNGEVQKIKRKEIKHLFLSRGNTICQETSMISIGNDPSMSAELIEDLHYFGLPTKKNGKAKDLHILLLESNDYMLTMYNSGSSSLVYIFRLSDDKLMSDPISYYKVGYGKTGKKSLAELKKYFKECPDFASALDEQIERNKSLSKFRKIPLLMNIKSNQCL